MVKSRTRSVEIECRLGWQLLHRGSARRCISRGQNGCSKRGGLGQRARL